MIKELYIKNIAATAENLLMVIRDKQWERLEAKVWALDNAIELYENNCREEKTSDEETTKK